MKNIILLMISVSVLMGCQTKDNINIHQKDEEIIKIATRTLKDIGVSVDVMSAEIDPNDEKWLSALSFEKQMYPSFGKQMNPEFAKRFDVLKGRDYYIVHYIPDANKVVMMGEAFVFVDKKTKKVITMRAGI